MKRTIFVMFAALTLVAAAPMMAQQDLAPTNPNAGNITSESGLTITGTVVESNDAQLTLQTTTGIQHIQIVPNTQSPVELTAGQNVSVDYTRTTQGVMIASKIRTEGTAPVAKESMAKATVDESKDSSMDTDLQAESDVDTSAKMDANVDANVDANADLNANADLDTDADLDTTMDERDSLPATGSELPLLGLLGLLGIAGAVGVRTAIR